MRFLPVLVFLGSVVALPSTFIKRDSPALPDVASRDLPQLVTIERASTDEPDLDLDLDLVAPSAELKGSSGGGSGGGGSKGGSGGGGSRGGSGGSKGSSSSGKTGSSSGGSKSGSSSSADKSADKAGTGSTGGGSPAPAGVAVAPPIRHGGAPSLAVSPLSVTLVVVAAAVVM